MSQETVVYRYPVPLSIYEPVRRLELPAFSEIVHIDLKPGDNMAFHVWAQVPVKPHRGIINRVFRIFRTGELIPAIAEPHKKWEHRQTLVIPCDVPGEVIVLHVFELAIG